MIRQAQAQIAAGDEAPFAHLNMSAAFVLRGDRDAALAALGRPVKSGYREYGLLTPDPIFPAILADGRFTALIEEMTAEVARQRRRAGELGLLELESVPPGIK